MNIAKKMATHFLRDPGLLLERAFCCEGMGDCKQFPSDQKNKSMHRLPDGMRERIAQAAEKEGRSMNAEIVRRLETTFAAPLEKKPRRGATDAPLSAIAEQAQRLRSLGQELAQLDEQHVAAEFVDNASRCALHASQPGISERRSKNKWKYRNFRLT